MKFNKNKFNHVAQPCGYITHNSSYTFAGMLRILVRIWAFFSHKTAHLQSTV